MKNNNLENYEKLRTVPKEAQKQFNNGKFSGTDINPMWRIKKMTEVFGMCGIGWYVEVVNREMIKADNGEQSAFVSVNLYIKDEKSGEWSKPIYGEGGNSYEKVTRNGISVSDEAFKMAYTDAIGSACKMIGMGADVYWNEDRTKYSSKEEQDVNDKKITQGQLGVLKKVYVGENLTRLLENNGLDNLEDMSIEKASEIISKLKKEGN